MLNHYDDEEVKEDADFDDDDEKEVEADVDDIDNVDVHAAFMLLFPFLSFVHQKTKNSNNEIATKTLWQQHKLC